jgi:transposase
MRALMLVGIPGDVETFWVAATVWKTGSKWLREIGELFGGLEGKSKVVLEACWNWGRIYDLLSEIEQVEEVVLAHPLKTRLIADAQIKTDGLDAYALATLLRGDLIARAHVPAKPTRQRKEVLRQRLYWARLRTRIRNRIHALIDRQRELKMPQCSCSLVSIVSSDPIFSFWQSAWCERRWQRRAGARLTLQRSRRDTA